MYTPLASIFYGDKTKCCIDPKLSQKNTVKDYNLLENKSDTGDVTLRRHIDEKYIRLENTTNRNLVIGIDIHDDVVASTYPLLNLRPKEVRHLGVNVPDEPSQYIWIFDSKTGAVLNKPHLIKTTANMFAIVEGVNNLWITDYWFTQN